MISLKDLILNDNTSTLDCTEGKLSSLTVGTSFGSGNSSLAVRMPCAFYSQQSSPKLDAPSASDTISDTISDT
nr:hypothetical protein [Tanacetum cinerariifolium]